jgi:hypothetical protein
VLQGLNSGELRGRRSAFPKATAGALSRPVFAFRGKALPDRIWSCGWISDGRGAGPAAPWPGATPQVRKHPEIHLCKLLGFDRNRGQSGKTKGVRSGGR